MHLELCFYSGSKRKGPHGIIIKQSYTLFLKKAFKTSLLFQTFAFSLTSLMRLKLLTVWRVLLLKCQKSFCLRGGGWVGWGENRRRGGGEENQFLLWVTSTSISWVLKHAIMHIIFCFLYKAFLSFQLLIKLHAFIRTLQHWWITF